MATIRFIKTAPTTYVLHFKNGQVRREGQGLSFFYYSPTSTQVTVPLASTDVPFAIQENTMDFQAETIQGQLTYRISDPKRLASLPGFSVNRTAYIDRMTTGSLRSGWCTPHKRLCGAKAQKLALRDALTRTGPLTNSVLEGLKASEAVSQLGVTILSLSLVSIRPTPEMAKALEAAAREALQRQSDEAIYARPGTTLWSKNAASRKAS